MVYVRLYQKGDRLYDPIAHVTRNPNDFGFAMMNLKYSLQCQEMWILWADECKENVGGFNQCRWRIPRAQVKAFKLVYKIYNIYLGTHI
jgi:hypothetical protein